MLDRALASRLRRITLVSIVGVVMFCGVAIHTPSAVANTSQIPWAPTQAPLPTSLPDGSTPASITLNSTSCSSASFCVAVGWVTGQNLETFPLAETYSQGSWSPKVLPMPANAATSSERGLEYDGSLNSVFCASDGACAAVGDYEDNASFQQGLLEVLSSGVWTPSEAVLPAGVRFPLVNLNSVTCSDPTTCLAVGDVFSSGNAAYGLLYSLVSGSWHMTVAPVPASYGNGATLSSVSCPDDGTCVVVGTYNRSSNDRIYGLILTLASGSWTASAAPLPSNVNIPPAGSTGGTFDSPDAVNCSEVNACVAGGLYLDSDNNIVPLLLELGAGGWTALQGPVPSDSQSNTLANIEGVYCPADGACIATGYYWTNYTAGDESGMILTQQSDGTWTAEPGPLPPDQTNSTLLAAGHTQRKARNATNGGTSTSVSTLAGVSCGFDAFCAAGGSEANAGLLETGTFGDLPSVTGVSPPSGPATGGTSVTIDGTNFGSDSVVSFGGSAVNTTFVSATRLEAVAPASFVSGAVDISVTTDGLRSRAGFRDLFSYGFSVATAALPPGATRLRYTTTLKVAGGNPPYKWSLLSGALPRGLHLRSTGVISGTPKVAESSTVTFRVTDHKTKSHPKETTTRTFSITITQSSRAAPQASGSRSGRIRSRH
jgi:hypothetical protein